MLRQNFTSGLLIPWSTREENVTALFPVVKYSFNLLSLSSSAPCPPTGLKVRMQRIGQNHWAMMSWDRVNCTNVEYLALVTGQIQNNPMSLMNISSYWLPRPYFEFPMPCSTSYTFTVRARNSAGESEPSIALNEITGNFTLHSLQKSEMSKSSHTVELNPF